MGNNGGFQCPLIIGIITTFRWFWSHLFQKQTEISGGGWYRSKCWDFRENWEISSFFFYVVGLVVDSWDVFLCDFGEIHHNGLPKTPQQIGIVGKKWENHQPKVRNPFINGNLSSENLHEINFKATQKWTIGQPRNSLRLGVSNFPQRNWAVGFQHCHIGGFFMSTMNFKPPK